MRVNHPASALVLVLALTQGACTLVGLGTGAILDEVGADRVTLANPSNGDDGGGSSHDGVVQLSEIQHGKTIKLTMKDGTQRKVKFYGLVALSDEDYAARYAARREQLEPAFQLPALGDAVTVARRDGSVRDGHLLGFNFDGVWLRSSDGAPAERVDPAEVARLSAADRRLDGDALAVLLAEGSIPWRGAIAVSEDGSLAPVPLDQVARAVRKTNTGRIVGLSLGVAIDAAIVAAVASMGPVGLSSY